MSLRSNGSYIGPRPTGPTNGIAGVASGIWDVRTAQRQRAAGAWPFALSSPTQITGLQLWLDASDASTLYDATSGGSLVAADGGVARWEDKSGNDRHATQGTAGSRPARKTAIQNGLDGLRFDGASDSMSIASSTATFKFLHGSTATLLYVAKYGTSANPNSQYGLVSTGGATGNEIGFFHSYDDRAPTVNEAISSSAIRDSGGNRAWLNRVNDKVSANAFVVGSEVIDASNGTAANRSTVRINGGAAIQGNTLTDTPSANNSQFDFTIGALVSSSLLSYMDGDIAEIIIYNSALSDTDREAVENYLMSKWAIT